MAGEPGGGLHQGEEMKVQILGYQITPTLVTVRVLAGGKVIAIPIPHRDILTEEALTESIREALVDVEAMAERMAILPKLLHKTFEL